VSTRLMVLNKVGMDPLTGGHMGPPLHNYICHLRFEI
jgi:hypothetical protein